MVYAISPPRWRLAAADTLAGRLRQLLCARTGPVRSLRALPRLAERPRRDVEVLDRVATAVDVPAGRVLMTQGRPGAECFIIESGTVVVEVDGTAVATLGPGDVVGERALLDRAPRNATVRTTSAVTLLAMQASEFDELRTTTTLLDDIA